MAKKFTVTVESEVVAVTLETRDYSLFHHDKENRPISIFPEHRWLYETMQSDGFNKNLPVLVWRDEKGRWIVLDGQHRLAIAEMLKLPVYYQFCDKRFDVAKYARGGVKWTQSDYANTFAKQGLADYAIVEDYAARSGFPVSLSAAILAGTLSFSNVSNAFCSGTYVVKDRGFAETVLNLCVQCKAIGPQFSGDAFVAAVVACLRSPGFDAARFLSRINASAGTLHKQSRRERWLDTLETAYNYRMKDLYPLKMNALQAMRARSAIITGK